MTEMTVHVRGLKNTPDHDYTITETREVVCPDCGETLTRYASLAEQNGRAWPEETEWLNQKLLIQHGWSA